MDITYKGQQCPAFYLMMKREFAQQILDGEKKVEFRFPSDANIAKFYDRSPDGKWSVKPRKFLHFTNYNKSWFLTVKIDRSGYVDATRENGRIFREKYGAHEIDDMCDDYEAEGIPEGDYERDGLIYLEIGALVATSLTPTPGKPGLKMYDGPAECTIEPLPRLAK